ncbi:hypothetical protein ACFXMT_14195 [Streptomyces mirabilis]|uniref:hypothetical protein n=1 Tax=Streptomyces mirabilis TaxID=68239 RepID=UPI003694E9F3
MLATHTQRRRPFSVHMTPDEAVDLVNEANEALRVAYGDFVELPALAMLADKVNKLIGSKEGTRA